MGELDDVRSCDGFRSCNDLLGTATGSCAKYVNINGEYGVTVLGFFVVTYIAVGGIVVILVMAVLIGTK